MKSSEDNRYARRSDAGEAVASTGAAGVLGIVEGMALIVCLTQQVVEAWAPKLNRIAGAKHDTPRVRRNETLVIALLPCRSPADTLRATRTMKSKGPEGAFPARRYKY